MCVLNRTQSFQLPLIAIGLAVALAAYGHLSLGETTYEPRPFDPLSVEEHDFAVATALGDPIVSTTLSERHVVIGASLNTDKGAMKQIDPPRRADVVLYDYEVNKVFQLIVDINLGAVVEHLDVAHYQPVLTAVEMARADELAADYPGIDAMLPGGHEIVRIAHLWTGPLSDCPGLDRCVIVGHYLDGFPDFSFFLLIDLSEDAVIGVIENSWWTEEAGA